MSYKVERKAIFFHCLRCDYEWYPNDPNKEPTACPKCHSPYWKKPRKDRPINDNSIKRIPKKKIYAEGSRKKRVS